MFIFVVLSRLTESDRNVHRIHLPKPRPEEDRAHHEERAIGRRHEEGGERRGDEQGYDVSPLGCDRNFGFHLFDNGMFLSVLPIFLHLLITIS